jgi:hypothetical protein
MRYAAVVAGAVVLAAASFALGQETAKTGKGLVDTYESIADVILGGNRAEKAVVTTILQQHRAHAGSAIKNGDSARAAEEMALFANEGDNAVGGVRKRLVSGGHHHNADGEAKGIFEEGYVVVTREVKKECLAASMEMQKATDDAGRKAAWKKFEDAAIKVVSER